MQARRVGKRLADHRLSFIKLMVTIGFALATHRAPNRGIERYNVLRFRNIALRFLSYRRQQRMSIRVCGFYRSIPVLNFNSPGRLYASKRMFERRATGSEKLSSIRGDVHVILDANAEFARN